jgi:hypothetical protein
MRLLVLVCVLAGCKPSSTKVQMGPMSVDRYEIALADGSKQYCYVFGAETSTPQRLCGDGSPTPDHVAVLFSAVAPPPGSEFVEKIGAPLEAGHYVLKPIGKERVHVIALGRPSMREWIAGKRLVTVETTADRTTRVRVVDPGAASERTFEVKTTTSEFILVREPEDKALLLVQKNGGEELLLLENPIDNPVLSMSSVSEGKSPGNRKFYNSASVDRARNQVFVPPTGFFGHIGWSGTKPTYDNAPMGPFEEQK